MPVVTDDDEATRKHFHILGEMLIWIARAKGDAAIAEVPSHLPDFALANSLSALAGRSNLHSLAFLSKRSP